MKIQDGNILGRGEYWPEERAIRGILKGDVTDAMARALNAARRTADVNSTAKVLVTVTLACNGRDAAIRALRMARAVEVVPGVTARVEWEDRTA